jgi:hypothetical protein
MSVQVLQVRFPGLLVAVSVERQHRQREGCPPSSIPAKVKRNRSAQRFSSIAGIEPNLIKLQM